MVVGGPPMADQSRSEGDLNKEIMDFITKSSTSDLGPLLNKLDNIHDPSHIVPSLANLVRQIINEKAELKKGMKEKQKENDELTSRMKDMQLRIKCNVSQINELEAILKAKNDSNFSKLDREKLADMEKSIERTRTKISNLETQNKLLNEVLDERSLELKEEKKRNEDMSSTIGVLKSKLEERTKSVEFLNDELYRVIGVDKEYNRVKKHNEYLRNIIKENKIVSESGDANSEEFNNWLKEDDSTASKYKKIKKKYLRNKRKLRDRDELVRMNEEFKGEVRQLKQNISAMEKEKRIALEKSKIVTGDLLKEVDRLVKKNENTQEELMKIRQEISDMKVKSLRSEGCRHDLNEKISKPGNILKDAKGANDGDVADVNDYGAYDVNDNLYSGGYRSWGDENNEDKSEYFSFERVANENSDKLGLNDLMGDYKDRISRTGNINIGDIDIREFKSPMIYNGPTEPAENLVHVTVPDTAVRNEEDGPIIMINDDHDVNGIQKKREDSGMTGLDGILQTGPTGIGQNLEKRGRRKGASRAKGRKGDITQPMVGDKSENLLLDEIDSKVNVDNAASIHTASTTATFKKILKKTERLKDKFKALEDELTKMKNDEGVRNNDDNNTDYKKSYNINSVKELAEYTDFL